MKALSKKHSLFFLGLTLAGLCGLLPNHADADQQVVVHIVRAGDTLASIAQSYYGDPRREVVLVAANGLAGSTDSKIRTGTRLIIPTTDYVRVQAGDTWSALALKWLGNAKRSRYLSALNKGNGPPEESSEIVIPFMLRHVAGQSQTITDLARLYYNDEAEAKPLRRFNRLRKVKLRRGQVVIVPMSALSLSPEARRRLEKELGRPLTSGSVRSIQQSIELRLGELHKLIKKGQYVESIALANQFLGAPALATTPFVAIQKELATAYIAIGRKDLATEAFKQALTKRPDLVLDSALTSPRVLAALSQAKKQLRRSPKK